MLLAHAVTLAEARSYVAALADQARTFEASAQYERALLQLDRLHGDDIPGLDQVPTAGRDVPFTVATTAIDALLIHGADALEVELVLGILEAARHQDVP